MITINTDRVFSIYTKTNRKVDWQYADYQGRYTSADEAVNMAKNRIKGNFEYIIRNIATGNEFTGKNQKGKKI